MFRQGQYTLLLFKKEMRRSRHFITILLIIIALILAQFYRLHYRLSSTLISTTFDDSHNRPSDEKCKRGPRMIQHPQDHFERMCAPTDAFFSTRDSLSQVSSNRPSSIDTQILPMQTFLPTTKMPIPLRLPTKVGHSPPLINTTASSS